MSAVQIDLDEDVLTLLLDIDPTVDRAVRDIIVFEMYRRGLISSGRGAEILQISRLDFIQRASRLGIPYIDFSLDEWETEWKNSLSL